MLCSGEPNEIADFYQDGQDGMRNNPPKAAQLACLFFIALHLVYQIMQHIPNGITSICCLLFWFSWTLYYYWLFVHSPFSGSESICTYGHRNRMVHFFAGGDRKSVV